MVFDGRLWTTLLVTIALLSGESSETMSGYLNSQNPSNTAALSLCRTGVLYAVVVVVVVFTLKTVLTSIQYPSLSYSSRQRNEFPWVCILHMN